MESPKSGLDLESTMADVDRQNKKATDRVAKDRERKQPPAIVLERIKERIKGYEKDKALEPHLVDNFLAITREMEGVHSLDVKLKSVMKDVEQRIKKAIDQGVKDDEAETVLGDLSAFMEIVETPFKGAQVGSVPLKMSGQFGSEIRKVQYAYYRDEKGYSRGVDGEELPACRKDLSLLLEKYLDEYIAKAELSASVPE